MRTWGDAYGYALVATGRVDAMFDPLLEWWDLAAVQIVIEEAGAVITRRDASDAVVMSIDSFNSLMETVHLLRSPANAAHLARSIAQLREGQVIEAAVVDG